MFSCGRQRSGSNIIFLCDWNAYGIAKIADLACLKFLVILLIICEEERSKSRLFFISLRYSRIRTAAVFFEEDIGVIWPCSVIMVAIIQVAIKLLLDAYLHKRE